MGYLGYLLVFIGAGVGGALRHGVNLGTARLIGTGLPYGTFAVNVIGSFVMGVLSEYWAQKSGLPQPVRLFLTTGILGGFTTFSSFGYESLMLLTEGNIAAAAAYSGGSLLLGLLAAGAGVLAGKGI